MRGNIAVNCIVAEPAAHCEDAAASATEKVNPVFTGTAVNHGVNSSVVNYVIARASIDCDAIAVAENGVRVRVGSYQNLVATIVSEGIFVRRALQSHAAIGVVKRRAECSGLFVAAGAESSSNIYTCANRAK